MVKNKSGLLAFICINTKGASANTFTVYDNASAASGTVIAIVDTTVAAGCTKYDVGTTNGITVIMQTGTAADITVGWR